MISISNCEIVADRTCLLGECPVWDNENSRIFWIDITAGDVHYFYPKTEKIYTYSLGKLIGSIGLKSPNTLIAALKSGFFEIDLLNNSINPIAFLEKEIPDIRFNDGKCDSTGRFWAGTMSITGTNKKGQLYTLEKNKTLTIKVDNVSCSNGMAWNKENNRFYYIDTPTQQVVEYDYNAKDGSITNPKKIITIEKNDGYPDGMTIDDEGMLWIALWNGWKVVRYNPSTGKRILEVKLPVSKVSSCTFGGDNYEDLYITSAKVDLTDEELRVEPFAGSLFVLRKSGFKGTPSNMVLI